MPLNTALIGKRYPEVPFVVEPGRIDAFRAAVGGPPNGVPPTFVTAAEFAVFPQIVADPDLGMDFSNVVHAEQEYEWHRPLTQGERLLVRSRIAEIRERAGLGLLVVETELVGAGGEVAVTARSTMLERDGR